MSAKGAEGEDGRLGRELREAQASMLGEIARFPVSFEDVWPLVTLLQIKDAETAAHTWRVTLYAMAMSEALGLERPVRERIAMGAALHDLGKIDIPDGILTKPGKLTEAEFEVIKGHPALGHDRLVRVGIEDPIILRLVRWHHERLDGTGYPDGLKAGEIPVGPRLFAVIDTFDALTSVRPYRREVGEGAAERALEILRADTGSHYCAESVALFESLYRDGTLDWILNYFNEDRPVPLFGQSGWTPDRGA